MNVLASIPLLFGDAVAASNVMRSFVTPVLATMIAIASLAVVFFLVYGGIQYMTSAGDPDRLDHAKRIIRNAFIGLVIVIAAGTLTAILTHAYQGGGHVMSEKLPALTPIDTKPPSFTEIVLKTMAGVLNSLIASGAKPFLAALSYFTTATPLMADNSSVFNLWLALAGITDVLFIVVVALLGFHIMSFTAFGLDEIEFKHLLPRLAAIFLLINTSIFAIDAVVSVSNAMIRALQAGFPTQTVWNSLSDVLTKADGLSLVALLLMLAFLVLIVILLIYYVFRLVVLYLGAVLAPLIFLIWLLPMFKDFAETAIKVYLTTIFVLFVHVVILQLGASILQGMTLDTPGQALNPVMSMIVGIAMGLVLLKTQGAMSQLSYASLGPKTMRKLGTEIASIASHYGGKDKKGRTSSDDEDGDSSKRGKGGSSESRRDSYRDDFDQSNDNYSSPTKRAPQYEASSSRTTEADIDYPTAAPRLAPKKPKPSSKPKEKENEA